LEKCEECIIINNKYTFLKKINKINNKKSNFEYLIEENMNIVISEKIFNLTVKLIDFLLQQDSIIYNKFKENKDIYEKFEKIKEEYKIKQVKTIVNKEYLNVFDIIEKITKIHLNYNQKRKINEDKIFEDQYIANLFKDEQEISRIENCLTRKNVKDLNKLVKEGKINMLFRDNKKVYKNKYNM